MTRARVVALAASVALLAGCGNLLEPAAAVVDGRKIPLSELDEALERFEQGRDFKELSQQQGADRLRHEFQQGYLSFLIRVEVLEDAAEDMGIDVDDEVEERLAEVREQYGSDDAIQKALGLSAEQMEDVILRAEVLEEELKAEVTAGIAPSEAEVRRFYDDNIEQYSETRAAHILVDSEDQAAQLSVALAGVAPDEVESTFARLARRYSNDQSSAENGGDLGWNPPGSFVAPFEEALAELEVGEVSGPVQTEFGWHVIRLVDRRTESFASVRDDIAGPLTEQMQEEAWQEWLHERYEAADIEVNPRIGELDLDTQRVTDPGADDVPGAEPTPTPSDTALAPEPGT